MYSLKFYIDRYMLISLIFLILNFLQPTFEDSVYNPQVLLWPLPQKISYNKLSAQKTYIDPCTINYRIQAVPSENIENILNYYLAEVFKCEQHQIHTKQQVSQINAQIVMSIAVRNSRQLSYEQIQQQKYQLTIRQNQKWEILADYYVGYVRALQTFSQLFVKDKNGYYIGARPILIDDIPRYKWRGLMIDTSRHFISVQALKRTINGLMYNKMSVLHWHITDQDSFPLQIQSRPQLSQFGKLSGTYSKQQVKDLTKFAQTRGVKLIPQFDTPAHTESWGRSQTLRQIVIRCDTKYSGQFDPTLNLTYAVLKDVMNYINSAFSQQYVHFGGDQLSQLCFLLRPKIQIWMQQHGIRTYRELEQYYRKKQKQSWRALTKTKKVIYWVNNAHGIPLQNDDVIQWWGSEKNVVGLQGKKNQVILSYTDLLYLNIGFGSTGGHNFGQYVTWRQIYENFDANVKNVNVIGGEACIWGQVSNKQVLDQKVWIRASALAERLWNPLQKSQIQQQISKIVERLVSQARRMKQRGLKVSTVTVGLCQNNPYSCFK